MSFLCFKVIGLNTLRHESALRLEMESFFEQKNDFILII